VSFDVERLYSLLPAVYRIRDTELSRQMGLSLSDDEEAELSDLLAQTSPLSLAQNARLLELLEKRRRSAGPLKALLAVIAEQTAVIEEDLAQLYDDLFIETCAEWVVPYIGDLVGARGLFVFPNAPFSQRAQVANTIAYRRRKGTASVLEQLARDVTAWNASVVEYFQVLATTQYMNHIRPENLSIAGLRDWEPLERINTPFDRVPHTADVRRIESRRGKYNIPNVGIFLWRLGEYRITRAPAFRVDDLRYTFDSLGKDVQLYNLPQSEEQITHLAEPVNVPMPLSRRVLDRYLETYYGIDIQGKVKSVLLNVDNEDVVPEEFGPPGSRLKDLICVCDLSDVVASNGVITWAHMPDDKIAIDPVLGRIAFPPTSPPHSSVRVTYHYGFSANMGGGEYGRITTFTGDLSRVVKVPAQQLTIQGALAQLIASGGVVEIKGNDSYNETLTVNVPTEQKIELRAEDKSRPTILPTGDIIIVGGDNSEVTLNGLLISGNIRVPATDADGNENKVRLLTLRHLTVVPGATITIESPNAALEIDNSIVGSILSADGAEVHIRNSIVDSTDETQPAYSGLSPDEPGAPLKVENSTIIGTVRTLVMELASNTIFFAVASQAIEFPVRAERLQRGCVRFCYVPPGSRLPRLHQCQPKSLSDAARVRPVFTSLRYGDAAYCQLDLRSAVEIREGADDRAEMGAFHDLYQPQRAGNLRARLDEYLRFGLEAGIFFAS
jgi:hypothetical protein